VTIAGAGARPGPGFASYMRDFARARSTLALVFCLPLIAIIGGLIIYPFFYSIYLSMLNKGETEFVGLENYLFLFNRSTFWMVVRQSILFTVVAVLFKALIGFVCAHLIHNVSERGQRVWRGLMLIPWVIPPARPSGRALRSSWSTSGTARRSS
jgi:multiple sugar transport system permease protein